MKTCTLFLALFLAPLSLTAQEVATQQERQAEEWTDKYNKWVAKYDNQVKKTHGKRQLAPSPPIWLPAVCASEGIPAGPIAEACKLFATIWSADPVALQISRDTTATRTKGEEKHHTSFLEMIHIDAGWMRSTYGEGEGIYGLAGLHFAIPMPGYRRVQFTIPPGAILLNTPDVTGGRKFGFGVPVGGVSFRLFDFRLGRQAMSAHVNLAKIWVAGASPTGPGGVGGQWADMAGFSMTLKK